MAIQVTPDELRDKADDFKTNCEEQLDIIDDSESLLQELIDDGFEGATAKAFQDKFEALKPELKAAANLLTEISDALNKAAENFEEMDNDMASALA